MLVLPEEGERGSGGGRWYNGKEAERTKGNGGKRRREGGGTGEESGEVEEKFSCGIMEDRIPCLLCFLNHTPVTAVAF